ncbi:hypothetical protein [Obesumbacterium proteus]|uniref:hypothetical protein n=1 Tax=Obesumbacterium proteus TaxID=82983 RepID=UPI0024310027|nr:hypothetical protein [Obesumbacterium proteus]
MKQRTTLAIVEARLLAINSCAHIDGNYINTKTKVWALYLDCNHHWLVLPESLMAGRSCPECAKKRRGMKRRATLESINIKLAGQRRTVRMVGEYVLGSSPSPAPLFKETSLRAGFLLSGIWTFSF